MRLHPQATGLGLVYTEGAAGLVVSSLSQRVVLPNTCEDHRPDVEEFEGSWSFYPPNTGTWTGGSGSLTPAWPCPLQAGPLLHLLMPGGSDINFHIKHDSLAKSMDSSHGNKEPFASLLAPNVRGEVLVGMGAVGLGRGFLHTALLLGPHLPSNPL